jgi:hypothetical protein
MATLAQPTGAQILATLVPSGAGTQLGTWNEEMIDAYIADALVNVVTQEFDYASDLLTDAGFVPSALTSAEWNVATMAMLYGIGYQLLQMDEATQTTISNEVQGGIRQATYNSRASQFFQMAELEWNKSPISIFNTKYYKNHTGGFGTSQTRRIDLNGQFSPILNIDIND